MVELDIALVDEAGVVLAHAVRAPAELRRPEAGRGLTQRVWQADRHLRGQGSAWLGKYIAGPILRRSALLVRVV